MKRWLLNFLGVVTLVLIPALSFALPVLPGGYDGSAWTASDSKRSAKAEFNVFEDGGTQYLSVLLSNLDNLTEYQNEVLTALTFDFVYGNPSLKPLSATIYSSSIVGNVPVPATNVGGEVGGEWGYNNNLSGAPDGATYGIGSAGLDGLFGSPNDANNTYFKNPSTSDANGNGDSYNLQSWLNVNGGQYGIVGPLGDPLLTNTNWAYVKNSILFTLEDVNSFFNVHTFDAGAEIENLNFMYGTSYNSTRVPEPATMLLFGSGLVLLFGLKRKETDN